jgi:hypothetical protein
MHLNKSQHSLCQWVPLCVYFLSHSNGKGYTKIYSNTYAFAALGADGSIATWGDIDYSHCQWVRLRLYYLDYPTP